MDKMQQLIIKKTVGKAAAALIEDGMSVGLGSGSTSACFIDALIERCRQGLKITAVATSEASAKQAREGGIPLFNMDEISVLDIAVDGADEIDSKKRMIKGGGGCLVREKIIAAASKEMIVIIDAGKRVAQLGAFGLPVEIIPFGIASAREHMRKLGFTGTLREKSPGIPYITDNGNYIVDVRYPALCADPEGDHQKLVNIPGIVDTGFFFNLAGRVVVGHDNGRVEILS